MTITTNDDGICVELHGREQVAALRAKISIPIHTITTVRFETSFQDWRKWQVRMPGTALPGRLIAGSYWTEEGWDFLYIRRPIKFIKPQAEDVLVIETTEDRYKRVILSSNLTESSGIIKWWNQTKTNRKSSPKTPKPKSS